MKDFKDKVVVVTGGASGVGRALGVDFAKEGAKVVLVDINQANLDKTLADLKADGLEVDAMTADVTSDESMAQLADQCFEKYGNVHILFNNAGVGLGEAARPIWSLPAKDWDWGIAVNTLGAVNGIRAFVPRMIESGEEGLVVNTSSGNGGLTSLPTTPIYAASKAALTSVTEVLHYQLLTANSKVKAAVMFPGPHVINTAILDSNASRPDRFAKEGDNSPKGYKTFKELTEATGLDLELTEPWEVSEYTLQAIKDDKFWIFPPEYESGLEKFSKRHEDIVSRKTPELPV